MQTSKARYIDTHCHLDLYKNVSEVIREAERAGVFVLGVTNTPSVFPYTENLSKQYGHVAPAIGLHPELILQRKHELPQLWEYLKRTRYVGEIGLDYVTRDQNVRMVQREIFSQIIDRCAQYPDKILTVHSRRSASDVIRIIGNSFPGKIIMHWFSGSEREADAAISDGYYFSFNSSMVKSKKGRTLALKIPRDRLLTETDGPFISISGHPVQPGHIPLIIESLAALFALDTVDLKQQIWTNYLSITGNSDKVIPPH
jgi:TatD DNase family protein